MRLPALLNAVRYASIATSPLYVFVCVSCLVVTMVLVCLLRASRTKANPPLPTVAFNSYTSRQRRIYHATSTDASTEQRGVRQAGQAHMDPLCLSMCFMWCGTIGESCRMKASSMASCCRLAWDDERLMCCPFRGTGGGGGGGGCA